jgi:Fe-S-cluster containining protein
MQTLREGMRDDTPAECTECAACCFSTLERYVEVKGSDYTQLGDAAERLVHFIGNRAYMRMVDGHCAALAVDVENRRFLCAVYHDRPAICRDLERGSPACMGERVTKRERPLLSIARKARDGLTVGAEAEATSCSPPAPCNAGGRR